MDEERVNGGDDGWELLGFVEVLAWVGEPEQDLPQLGGVFAAFSQTGQGPVHAVTVALRNLLPAGTFQELRYFIALAVVEMVVAADDAGQLLQRVDVQDAEWGLRGHADPSVPGISVS